MDTWGKPMQACPVKPRFARQEIAMFETEQFIADCRAAVAADPTHKSIRDVLARAVAEPAAVLRDSASRNAPKSARCSIPIH
jgi:hypothetical protein